MKISTIIWALPITQFKSFFERNKLLDLDISDLINIPNQDLFLDSREYPYEKEFFMVKNYIGNLSDLKLEKDILSYTTKDKINYSLKLDIENKLIIQCIASNGFKISHKYIGNKLSFVEVITPNKVIHYHYIYDPITNLLKIESSVNSSELLIGNYEYDSLNRLIHHYTNDGFWEKFQYMDSGIARVQCSEYDYHYFEQYNEYNDLIYRYCSNMKYSEYKIYNKYRDIEHHIINNKIISYIYDDHRNLISIQTATNCTFSLEPFTLNHDKIISEIDNIIFNVEYVNEIEYYANGQLKKINNLILPFIENKK